MSRAPMNLPMLSPVGGKALLTMRRMSLENTSPSSQANLPIFSSKQKMFDQLFIFGCSPEKTSDERPIILTMFPSTEYPQDDNDLDYIKQLCFPNGFKEIDSNIPTSEVIINEFLFFLDSLTPTKTTKSSNSKANMSKEDIISNEFNNDRVYGIVVQFRAPPDFTPYFASTINRRFPFALCLLSHKYFLSSHFQFATYVSLVLTGRATAVQNKVRAPLPVRGFCHPTLALDKKVPAIAVFPGFTAPIHLLDIISKYAGRPTEPQTTPITDSPYTNKVPMAIPLNMSIMQCLSYPSTDLLFSCLTIEQIVRIYEAILLEKKVAFISKDPHISSLCALACMSILRPFRTFSDFIPVFTTAHLSLLSSNSPIVCGIYCESSSDSKDFLIHFDVIAVVNNSIEDASTSHNSTSNSASSFSLNSESIASSEVMSTNLNTNSASTVLTLVNSSLESPENHVIFTADLPNLPHFDDIVRKINLVIQNRITQAKVPPAEVKPFFGNPAPNPEFINFLENNVEPFVFPPYYIAQHPQKYVFPTFLVDSIREIFASHIAMELNEKIKLSCANFELNKEDFFNRFQENEKLFMTLFSKTWIFDDFLSRTQKQLIRKASANASANPSSPASPMRMSPTSSNAASHFENVPTSRPMPFPAYSKKITIKSPTAPFSPFPKDYS
ncbi:Scytalone dehydratase [Tritrichomonas musculus]|uniref:Scytalone dehydratase n=1 Tax=Tritrichomonas musculus TaxID=1915356 RepID=A0ABR2GQC3_9EUKA